MLDAKRKRSSSTQNIDLTMQEEMTEPQDSTQTGKDDEEILEGSERVEDPAQDPEGRSDSSIAYCREELEESEGESEEEINLTQRERRNTETPVQMVSPDDIEISDLLRWISVHTQFKLCSPPSHSDGAELFAMASQYVPPKSESEFLTLSTSPAIKHIGARRTTEALDKEKDSGLAIGKVVPSAFCKIGMRQYQLGDEGIRQSAPLWHSERPDWLAKITPQTRLYMSDAHAIRLDTAAREALTIVSRIDACASAIQHTIPLTEDIESAYAIRALRAIGGGIGDVARLLVSISHQISTHRRDAAMWDTKSRRVATRDMLALRHAPFLGEEFVFSPEMISAITEKRQEEAQKKAIMRVATAPSVIQVQSPVRQATPKRTLQLAKKEETHAKKRKQVTPRKAQSAKSAPAAQGTPSTPTSAPKAKAHR